jgi:molecular chaperone GrpE (heat shock protein)
MPKALNDFGSTLPPGSQLGVVLFGSGATLVKGLNSAPSPDFEAALAEALHYRTRLSNLSAGVERAIYELRENGRGNAERVILIVSDGRRAGATSAATEDNTRWLLSGLTDEAKRNGVRIATTVLGNEPDFRIAQTMALATGGSYFRALTATSLPGLLPKMLASATRASASGAKPDRLVPAPANVVLARYPYWPWLLSVTILLVAIAAATLFLSYRFRGESVGTLTERAKPLRLNLPSPSMPQLRDQGGAALKTIAEASQLLRSLEEQLKTLQTISAESVITADRAAESAEEGYSSLINDCISTVEFLEIMSRQESLSGDASMALGRALKRVARILEHSQVIEIPVQCGMPFDNATQEHSTSADRGEPYGVVTKIERKGYMMTSPLRGSVVLRPVRVEVSCRPVTQEGPQSSI